MRSLFDWLPKRKLGNLNDFEQKIYSQFGEDGIIQALFKQIGTTNKYFVEFGVEDGIECNTRLLREQYGWQGLMMDGKTTSNPNVKQEFITAENINSLLDKYHVPHEFDLLSIDIDGNDYYVWKAIVGRVPRCVVIEYNAHVPPHERKVIAYEPAIVWDGTDYFGASLSALVELGLSKGYTLVCCSKNGVNAFFVRTDLAQRYFRIRPLEALFSPPGFGQTENGHYIGHPRSKRNLISL